ISYEVEHIGSHQERLWLRQVIESGEHRRPLSADEKRKLLSRLTAVETLERFLHKAYLGQKRFSIEGLDALVPLLDQTVELAGAIHLIANNQLGFTPDPREGRSTDYSSDLAKGFDVPIIHVNADDPEACLAAARLAMMYRDKFHGDVVLDVVGYRRHGHNEGDEPAYTQPVMYERIKQTPTVRQRYAEQLAREGVVAAAATPTEPA